MIATFGLDESDEKRNFLALTNPEIRKEIEKEKKEMDNFLKRIDEERIAKDKKMDETFEEISRFCDYWLKGVATVNDGSYSWSKSIINRYGVKSEQEGRMDPLSSICLTYGMERDSAKYYGSQPKTLIYKTTYSSIPEWSKYRQIICKSDPRFCA